MSNKSISSLYATIGDVCHVINIVNVMYYAFVVVSYGHPDNPKARQWFDKDWLSEGFCIINPDVPYWNSHDLCLYADTVLALVVGVVYLTLKDRIVLDVSKHKMQQVNDTMKWQAFSVLAHGMGHGMLGFEMRNADPNMGPIDRHGTQLEVRIGSSDFSEYTLDMYMKLLRCIGTGMIFWFPLLRSAMRRNISNLVVFVATLITATVSMWVQKQHGFTYVQTVISLAFGGNELLCKTRTEKSNISYAVFAFVGIPIGLIPWAEAMACNSGFKQMGGHVLYDASIPVFLILAYVTCYYQVRSEDKILAKQGPAMYDDVADKVKAQ